MLHRTAGSMDAIPAVFPVNYHAVDRAIHSVTGKGTELATATRKAVVAFEIDEIDVSYHMIGAFWPWASPTSWRIPWLSRWFADSRFNLGHRVRENISSGSCPTSYRVVESASAP